jgi:hypothetical protein
MALANPAVHTALEYADGVIDLCGPVYDVESGVIDTLRPMVGETRDELLAFYGYLKASDGRVVRTVAGRALEYNVAPITPLPRWVARARDGRLPAKDLTGS